MSLSHWFSVGGNESGDTATASPPRKNSRTAQVALQRCLILNVSKSKDIVLCRDGYYPKIDFKAKISFNHFWDGGMDALAKPL